MQSNKFAADKMCIAYLAIFIRWQQQQTQQQQQQQEQQLQQQMFNRSNKFSYCCCCCCCICKWNENNNSKTQIFRREITRNLTGPTHTHTTHSHTRICDLFARCDNEWNFSFYFFPAKFAAISATTITTTENSKVFKRRQNLNRELSRVEISLV